MKKLTAIIQPFRLARTLEALRKARVAGVTLTEVRGCGRQKGVVELHRGIAYAKTLLPKLELEVVVRDGDLMEAVLAIAHSAHTGKVGGGKILVSPVERAVRVRTGERGDAALA